VAADVVERSIAPLLSLVDILDDLLWHRDGRVSLVYRVHALHEPSLSDDDFDKHAFLAENVFNSGVPDGTAWQFFVLVDHEAGLREIDRALPPITDPSPSGRLFEEFRQSKVDELMRVETSAAGAAMVQARRHYVVVSFAPRSLDASLWREWTLKVRGWFSRGDGDLRNGWGKYGDAYRRTLEQAARMDRAVRVALLQMGLGFRRCDTQEITRFYFEMLNPTASPDVEVGDLSARSRIERDGLPRSIVGESPWAGDSSPVSSLLADDLLVRRDFLRVGEWHVAVVSLREMPDRTEPGMLVPLLHLGRERYAVCYRVDLPQASAEIAALRAKATLAAGLRLQNFLVESDRKNAAAEAVQRQSDEAIDRMISSTQRICGISLQLVVYESSSAALDEAVQELVGVLSRAHGLRGVREHFMLQRAYLSCLPGAPVLVERRRKALSANAVDMLPIYDFRLGAGKVPFLTPRNSLVLMEPWSPLLPNANILITGTSGSGKSFLASTILSSYEMACRAQGERPPYVFVLDNGASYKTFMDLRPDGRYVTFSVDRTPGVDVFAWEPEEGSLDEHISRLEWLLLDLLKVNPQPEERFERLKACVEEALYILYRGEGPFDIERFAAVLATLPQASELLPGLFPLTEGKFARLLRPNPELALTDGVRAVCYDFAGLSEHRDLAMTALRLVIYQVWRWAARVARRRERTFLLVDESWALMDSGAVAQQGAPFLSASVRMGRKAGMSVLSLSQSIRDWADSAHGLAIIGNSGTKFVGASGPAELDELRRHLNLSDRQVEDVRRLARSDRYHEFLMVQGATSQVVRVPGDPLSRWVFTTSPADRERLARLAESHPAMPLLDRIRLLARAD
jgi:type IV secretory system conjugative DNA transfer VirD4/TraG family protein/type IV secretion system CagE/TrbE/VirB family protein